MQRQTKIIVTLGPATSDRDSIRALVDAGMDVARLNFSHGDHDLHRSLYGWVREASEDAGRAVGVMQDIQGPKLRIGDLEPDHIHLPRGMTVRLVPGSGPGDETTIPVGFDTLLEDIEAGHRVILADGLVTLQVEGSDGSSLTAAVVDGGRLSSHKGVAFPDSSLTVGNVTPKDEADLELGRALGVDYVAASFVRGPEDVETVVALAGDVPIISKIELAQALDNLDAILSVSAGAMVARGDLGVQLPLETIPLVQADILDRTNSAGRISVTATEMLESMTHSPRPTRAEVTDVANAVMAGTDAVMLSGETAVGEYPVETVRAMARICETVEQGTLSRRGDHPVPFVGDHHNVASAVAQAATQIAHHVGAKLIVAFTESGSTARLISKYRPEERVIAFSPNGETLNRMALYWGVTPHAFDRRESTDEEMALAASMLEGDGLVSRGDRVVMVAGVPPNFKATTNLVKVHRVGELSGRLGG